MLSLCERFQEVFSLAERGKDEEDVSEDVGYGTYDMEEDEEEASKAAAAKEVKYKIKFKTTR